MQATGVFDAHFHVIDPHFALAGNRGYVPSPFTCTDYRARVARLGVTGGAVVAGSFQGTDQDPLVGALRQLGPGYVGVAHLAADAADDDIARLHREGVRAIRFNLVRDEPGGPADIERLARRVHELAGWHSEFYLDAAVLPELEPMLRRLPQISIDHLGMRDDPTGALLRLVERGAVVKATGFGRMMVERPDRLMRDIVAVDPACLVFGTDLPSTRAATPFRDDDLRRVRDAVGPEHVDAVLRDNARRLYRLDSALTRSPDPADG